MNLEDYNRAVDDYSDRIFRFILKSLGDEERAKDIVQDSYEKLWRNIDDLEFSKAKSWLFSTAYNTMIDIIRKEKRMISSDDSITEEYTCEGYSDLNEVLHLCLEKLPDNYKAPLLLRDYEGYSYNEISTITGQSESQVKINIYRGRMAMRKMIGNIALVV
ncbi:MAG: RNA polymerase sigma factor [Marinilabiliaceae bacterium]|jgi:RNA polymerase sigma-70 factor (ECF subfamily)|nr:RNA polymerase sigma factor [Marinilabiliaceae bacterium]